LTFSANRELENDEECAFYLGSWVFSQNRNGVTPRIDTYVLNSFKTYVRPDLQKRAELYLGQAIRLLGGRLSGRVEIDHSSLRVSSWSFHREDLKALAHYLVELGAISWEPGTENYQLVAKAHVLYDQWANTRGMTSQAVVLSFSIDRDLLAGADTLVFVAATPDYWDLVHDCRLGFRSHGRPGAKATYDVVCGPVSLWRQELVIHDSDQMSIHDQSLASQLPIPTVHRFAIATSGFL